jgi:hypothetical protein
VPLADYARLPRRTAGFRSGFGPLRGPSTPQGAGYGSDVYRWAAGVVEKIRVASAGGRFRFLPWYDPYTEETPEMRASYRLMLADPIVLGAFRTTVFSVISQEWQFQPDDDDDPRQREAVEFCRYVFGKVEGGTPAVGWSVLAHGQIDGHSVCEPVWDPDPIPFGRFRGKRRFLRVKAKDTRFLQLGIDSYRNVTAVRGMGFNAGRVYDPAGFAVFSNLPLFENPAGMSAMRSCYGAFWRKDTALKLRSLHLSNYVGPYLKGTYGDASAKLALEEAFAEAKSDHWLTVPATCLVEAIDLSMKGTEEFQRTIDYEDKIILVALTGSHLPQMESTSGSGQRGNTKVQQEQGQLVPWYLSACLCEVAKKSLVAPLVAENYYGVEPPSVTLGAISEQARLQLVQVFKGMQELGLDLSKSQTYKDLGQQQPAEADDVLRPPGQGGGDAGGLPGMPPGPGGGGGPGGAPGSPFSEARPFDDVYHGPKPPRPAWRDFACREVTGPRGGKKHQADGGPPRYGPCPKGKEAVALGRQARQEAKKKAQEAQRAAKAKAREDAGAALALAREDALKQLAALKDDPKSVTPAKVKKLGEALKSLTAEQLRQAKRQIQAAGGGATKEALVERIKEHVVGLKPARGKGAAGPPPAPAKGKAPGLPPLVLPEVPDLPPPPAVDTSPLPPPPAGALDTAIPIAGRLAAATHLREAARRLLALHEHEGRLGEGYKVLGGQADALGEEARGVLAEAETLAKSRGAAGKERYSGLLLRASAMFDRASALRGRALELSHEREKAREAARAALKRMASADRPTTVGAAVGRSADSPRLRPAIDAATGFLDGLAGKGPGGEDLPRYHVTIEPGKTRAHYNDHDHTVNAGHEGQSAGVIVHEVGHGMEYKMPGAQAAALEFLRYRLKGEAPVRLKDVFPGGIYRDNETGAKDDFGRYFEGSGAYYVGKVYPDGGTEVVSMGVQALYEDPARFAAADPEYFAFTLGVLRGELRNRPDEVIVP